MRIRSFLLALCPVVVLQLLAWPSAAATAGPASSAVLDPVHVHAMRGKSTLLWRGRRWVLKADTEVEENQPIHVAEGAALRLRMGRRALLDLGPGTRLVILQLARDGAAEGARTTRLLLEQGYLRIVASGELPDLPIDVAFSGWSARTGAGEHFFEAAGAEASACSTNGPIAIDGFPGWRPRDASAPCVMLWRDRVPVELSLESHQWEFLRRNRTLYPTLASIAQQSAASAVARLEQEAQQVVVAPTIDDAAAAQALLDSAPPAAGPLWPSDVPAADLDRAEWIVNVATYADPERAQQHARQLVEQRFHAAVRPETINRRAAYRVVIEGLPDESTAQSVVSDLGNRYGWSSAWAMRKR